MNVEIYSEPDERNMARINMRNKYAVHLFSASCVQGRHITSTLALTQLAEP